LLLKSQRNGSPHTTEIDIHFLNSPDFKELQKYSQELEEIGNPPYSLEIDDKSIPVKSINEILPTVLDYARKGKDIQRYKGLGEMNPEQLWETTMKPDTRVLLQVKIEAAMEADQMFTVLMGDNVEPRREFIEQHALEVRNLDI